MRAFTLPPLSFFKLFTLASVIVVASISANADPLVVSGSATLVNGSPAVQGTVQITALNFAANVTTSNGNFGLAPCSTSTAGAENGCTSANLSWTSVGVDLNGTVTWNGVVFPVTLQDSFGVVFNSISFVIPPEFLSASAIQITAPFTFMGGFSRESTGEHVDLTGEGTVHVFLVNTSINGFKGIYLDHADYIFGPRTDSLTIKPVPEPVTILLLMSGIAGTALHLRRRKNSS